MPNQPKTQHRSVRVPDELWEASKAKAAQEGRTVTDVVNDALRSYVQGASGPLQIDGVEFRVD
jgi:hypothetical protein